MLSRRGFLALIGAAAGAQLSVPAGAAARQETGFVDRSLTFGGETYRYPVFVPANWKKKQKWPTILFLHGAGERGRNGLFSSDIALGRAIRRYEKVFPAVVAFPQCREEKWWTNADMEELALAALDQTTREFSGDKQRVYLTGLSMGGFGTWDIAAQHAERFAAIAPICGGVNVPALGIGGAMKTYLIPAAENSKDAFNVVARKVGKLPVWVFHGAADTTIPVEESRKMVAALRAIGGNVRYSEYEGVGHNSWDRAYAEPEFFTWLLAQKRQ